MACIGPYCNGCINQQAGLVRLEPDGLGKLGILLVGDSPWKDEIAAKRNFSGAAGRYLNKTLARLALNRDHFITANTMACKPPELGWTDEAYAYEQPNKAARAAIEQCAPYLDGLIARMQPKVIVTLGNVALHRVCGVSGLNDRHSYVHQTGYGVPAIPTFHPSHLIQGAQKLTIALMFALRRAQEIALAKYQPTKLTLHEDMPPAQLRQYVERHKVNGRLPYFMNDIETPETEAGADEEVAESDASYNILRGGFSLKPWEAVTFPFVQPYIDIYKEAAACADSVLYWNKDYDWPRLRHAGFTLSEQARVIDAMWMWHFLQSDLPKALGFVAPFYYAGPAWKHLSGSEPAFYNACDNAIQSGVEHGIRADLVKSGRWDAFYRHCVLASPILVGMGERGVKVDSLQQAMFMSKIEEEQKVEEQAIDGLVPAELHKVKVWKRRPSDPEAKLRYLPHGEQLPILEAGEQLSTGVPQWYKDIPFNPNSSQQIAELIRHYKLKMPIKRGSGGKTTTDATHLKRFISHPIFKHIVAYKQRDKLISTYKWQLDENGRVHTHYNWNPSTWRKASYAYNLQNIPKRGDLADQFRRMIVASPGCILMEGDSAAIEAVLVGYYAGSNSYMNLAKAGVHGWLASHVLKQPIDWQLPLPELTAACRAMKKANKIVYEAAKRCIHGSNYLLSPHGMYDEYMEFFESEAACSKLQGLYFSLPPGAEVREWQRATVDEANEPPFKLSIPYGYEHRFYAVTQWDAKSRSEKLGPDAKRAVGFRPQSTASAVQTEILLRLAAIPGMLELLRLIIHDSFVLELPEAMMDWAGGELYREMTAPLPELGGLAIGAEVTWGLNLAPYQAKDIYDTNGKLITTANPNGMREWQAQRVST